MAEEYMNVNEVRQLLGMPKYEFTERESNSSFRGIQ